MSERFLVEAVNDALHVELERDPSVLVMGEDVGRLGGVFRATAGLQERFGADRCVDTPLAEAGIIGTAVGLCMAGWRPVCEMQYDAFSYPALDQLINHVGRYRWRTRGTMSFPLVIRMPYGGGVRAPELHDDSPETYYVHTPGVKVAIPSTPADAKGLLAAAIRDPDPVVIFEPKLIYRTARGEVPEGEHVVPLGKARVAREGSDVTLVAYGAMVPLAERAADALENEASCEVLDLRSLKPLDEDALLASVGKTGRAVLVQEAPRVCGFAAEVAAVLAEKAIFDLRGPVLRVTGYDVPYPYWQIEDAYMPSVERIRDAVRRVLASLAGMADRLRLWLERGDRGYHLRDAETEAPVRWEDPRIRVVPVAGVSYRQGLLDDPSFDPDAGWRSCASPTILMTETRSRSATRSGRFNSATSPRPSPPTSTATSRPCRCGASTAACACSSPPPMPGSESPRKMLDREFTAGRMTATGCAPIPD